MNRPSLLTGERVALCPMTPEDQIQFHAWLQSPELRALIDDPRVPTMEDQVRWFERVQKPDREFFSLVTVQDSVLIGNGGFVDIDSERLSATLRITIGHPQYRGKGLGSEAVALLVRYGFEIAHWRTINLKVLQTNERAIRSYEKAGFVPTGEEDLQEGKTIITMSLDSPHA